jgi:hypothetical protein
VGNPYGLKESWKACRKWIPGSQGGFLGGKSIWTKKVLESMQEVDSGKPRRLPGWEIHMD